MHPSVLLSRLVGVGWETAGQACEYLQVLLTERFSGLADGHRWQRVVVMLPFFVLLVACQHALVDYLLVFVVRVPVVDGQAVFLFVCAYPENLVCDVQ